MARLRRSRRYLVRDAPELGVKQMDRTTILGTKYKSGLGIDTVLIVNSNKNGIDWMDK